MRAALLPAPEDHPLFDPEDDRAEYSDDCETVAAPDFDAVAWLDVWPESIEV